MPPRVLLKPFCSGLFVLLCVTSPSSANAQCGDFNADGSVSATDALGIMSVAVGASTCDAWRCDVDGSGTVSATDALRVLQSAVGQPVSMSCPVSPASCATDMDFFFANIWTPIMTDCVACHSTTGPASYTDHVLQDPSVEGYLEYNFNAWRDYAAITEGKIGADLLLSKPQGIAHGGGQRLEMTPESIHYANIEELLDRFAEPVGQCPGAPADFLEGVTNHSRSEVLRKAALLFAGRLPTDQETHAVSRGGDARLRRYIRALMTGEAFEQFLIESANDQLLTDKFLNWSSQAFEVLRGEYEYPHIFERTNAAMAESDEAGYLAWTATNRALAREPLQLIVNVVTKERPYSEVLTADYMMVNPWSAVPYQAGITFNDNDSETEWREATNQGYRLPNYPHAGLLTSPMFLARYPSSAVNRNRTRARRAYQFFLGTDIETLAERPTDPDVLADTDNPTLTNVHCTVCHSVMDPIASAFQNWADDSIYLEWDTDSLPWSYKTGDLYQWGDRWYRDMRSPGFNNIAMPSTQDDHALQWLAEQLVADPRFPIGTVKFWWRGLFGEDPIVAPTEPTDADYQSRLAAYTAQNEVLVEIAAAFRDGTAGTAENGPFNLKDLLVEMAMTPYFRAAAASDLGADRADELSEVGLVKLLSPEQLNRKLNALTGSRWNIPWSPDDDELLTRYRTFYGGIDSDGIATRATELNVLMGAVVQRMANEISCPVAVTEFSAPASERLLFPLVEPTDTPDTPAGETAIRDNIVYLHDRLLGEVLAVDDPEVDATYQLFAQVRRLRIDQGKGTYLPWGSGYCPLDFQSGAYIDTDHNHTIRAWIAVLIYLMSDYHFLYE